MLFFFSREEMLYHTFQLLLLFAEVCINILLYLIIYSLFLNKIF